MLAHEKKVIELEDYLVSLLAAALKTDKELKLLVCGATENLKSNY